MKRELAANGENGPDVDWYGNNAAFTCPICRKAVIGSAMINRKGRSCLLCQQSQAFVTGKPEGGFPYIEWDEADLPKSKSATIRLS